MAKKYNCIDDPFFQAISSFLPETQTKLEELLLGELIYRIDDCRAKKQRILDLETAQSNFVTLIENANRHVDHARKAVHDAEARVGAAEAKTSAAIAQLTQLQSVISQAMAANDPKSTKTFAASGAPIQSTSLLKQHEQQLTHQATASAAELAATQGRRCQACFRNLNNDAGNFCSKACRAHAHSCGYPL